jgi:hypothetical protein
LPLIAPDIRPVIPPAIIGSQFMIRNYSSLKKSSFFEDSAGSGVS